MDILGNLTTESNGQGYSVAQQLYHMFSTLSTSSEVAFLVGGLAFTVAAVSYFAGGPNPAVSSRKAQQARAMREAYKSMEKQSDSSKSNTTKNPTAEKGSMQISELWVYPVKSLRGCKIPQALVTKEGFYLDRRFVLMKEDEKAPGQLKHMAISTYANMCLFHPSIQGDMLTIMYRPPGRAPTDADTLEVPLEPAQLGSLKRVDINMHFSPTKGYDMGTKYSKWFSERFGFKVILAYWGQNPRLVLGNNPGKPKGPKPKTALTRVISCLPVIGPMLQEQEDTIAFNDCAPYLVISESSVSDVSTRLPEGVQMDASKFRANIVLATTDTAYSEDFWSELTFSDDTKILLTGNCGRCNSLNVDYNTGESGTGRDGQVLKLLQKDRRVDVGTKYSPIFGRYGFASKESEGKILRIGDTVSVSGRNEERTRFYWPGLST